MRGFEREENTSMYEEQSRANWHLLAWNLDHGNRNGGNCLCFYLPMEWDFAHWGFENMLLQNFSLELKCCTFLRRVHRIFLSFQSLSMILGFLG